MKSVNCFIAPTLRKAAHCLPRSVMRIVEGARVVSTAMRNNLQIGERLVCLRAERGSAGQVGYQQRRRPGFSLIELAVAMVIFGIAVSGVCPHAVMHIKHLRRLASRFSPETTYYLAPSLDRWARKLGAAASISTIDPGSTTPAADADPANDVKVTAIEKSLISETVTVHATVEPVSP